MVPCSDLVQEMASRGRNMSQHSMKHLNESQREEFPNYGQLLQRPKGIPAAAKNLVLDDDDDDAMKVDGEH